MGFLSSLFGVGDSKPATSVVQQTSKFPEELAPYIKEILGEAQELYGAQRERGYDPYTGATIAPLTPEELQAQEGLKGLVGTAQPYLDEALEIQRTGAEKFTPEAAQAYMSPYQRAVTDIEKREAQKVFERDIMPQFEKKAADAGGMSGLGTRAGIMAGQLGQAQMQQMGDIEAKGLQKSYLDAQKLFAEQKARERQMAGDIGRAGTGLYQAGLADQGLLQDIGQQKRELGQSALDEAYYKFLKEQSYPQDIISQYSGTVYGAPNIGPSKTITSTGTPYQPSTGQTLLGLGLTGLNIYGMGGGFNQPAGGFSPNMFFTGKRAAGGGKVGMSDKNLGKYMEQGSGAISASNRDRLMRLYKSGLSGLPVVRRQTNGPILPGEDPTNPKGVYASIWDGSPPPTETKKALEAINQYIYLPRGTLHSVGRGGPGEFEGIGLSSDSKTNPTKSKRVGETVSGMNILEALLKKYKVTPPDPKELKQREQDYASKVARKTQEFETGEETARAERFERRMERAKEGNPMARFAAIQKAIQAGVMGPQGFDPVTGMKVYGEEMAPLNEKMLDLINTIDEEDEAIKAGQRKRKHERLIKALKTDKELQERLIALPRKNMREVLADLAKIGSVEELFSKIEKNKKDSIASLRTYLLNVAKLDAKTLEIVLTNYELAQLNPEGFDAILRELGIDQKLIDKIRNEINKKGTGEATDSITTSPRKRRDLKKTLESIKNK